MAKVFISHSTVDKPFVRRLQKDLENMGVQTWIDEEKAFAGYALKESLETGITTCTHFLLIVSPNSVKSDWVKREIDKAISLFGKRNIIPVVYRKAEIPNGLRDLIYVDFSDIIFTLNNDMTIVNYHGPEYPEGIKKVMAAIRNSESEVRITRPEILERDEFLAEPNQPSTPDVSVKYQAPVTTNINAPVAKSIIPIKCRADGFQSEQKKEQLIEFIAKKYPHIIKEKNLIPIILPAELRGKFPDINIGETIAFVSEKNKSSIITHFCGFASNVDCVIFPDEVMKLFRLRSKEYFWISLSQKEGQVEVCIID